MSAAHNGKLKDLMKQLFSSADEDELRKAIFSADFSSVPGMPADVLQTIREYPDTVTDIEWYLDIRDTVDIDKYPCVHIAYACSAAAGSVLEEHLGMFSIVTNAGVRESIVIGFCPWCACALNTSAIGA